MPVERGCVCSLPTKMIRADKLKEQWSAVVSGIELFEDWQLRIEELASDGQEREAILRERKAIEERLRRLARLYQDMLVSDSEYRESKENWQRKLETLIVPENPKLMKAGRYLENLGNLWDEASLEEKRDLTRIMVSSITIDVMEEGIVGIGAKDSFHIVLSKVC
jgi:hypothetical protein